VPFVPSCGYVPINVVLSFAVKEGRQIINLNRAYVDMFAGVHIQAAAESHGKRGGAPGAIVKGRADMFYAEQPFDKWGHPFRAPVVARAGQ
jgi:hypothetical protein